MSPEERFVENCEKIIQELDEIDSLLDRISVKLNGNGSVNP